MLFVGGQSGLNTILLQKDPCSEFRFSSPHDNCGLIGALPPPPGYTRREVVSGRSVAVNNIGGVSILKPKELGGITGYDMTTGDKKWWFPNGNAWREQTTASPLFSGVTLPRVPVFGGQPQLINTKTLLIWHWSSGWRWRPRGRVAQGRRRWRHRGPSRFDAIPASCCCRQGRGGSCEIRILR
jgi:quinoprotein glucose dehydrogenase